MPTLQLDPATTTSNIELHFPRQIKMSDSPPPIIKTQNFTLFPRARERLQPQRNQMMQRQVRESESETEGEGGAGRGRGAPGGRAWHSVGRAASGTGHRHHYFWSCNLTLPTARTWGTRRTPPARALPHARYTLYFPSILHRAWPSPSLRAMPPLSPCPVSYSRSVWELCFPVRDGLAELPHALPP